MLKAEMLGAWLAIVTVKGFERPIGITNTSVRLPGAASAATLTMTSRHAGPFPLRTMLDTVTPAEGENSTLCGMAPPGTTTLITVDWPRGSCFGKKLSMAIGCGCCASPT
jgi:hypothetical protein